MSQLVSEMVKITFVLKSYDFSFSALAKWILSVCLNIHTFHQIQSNGLHNEIARLKELKKLVVRTITASELKEVTLIASNIKTTLLTSS